MSEFDSPSYVEYVYDKKTEGKIRVLKYLLIFVYALFVIAFFCICYVTRLVPLFAVCPIVTWILIYFTWPLVSYDVYYTFEHGHIVLGKIKRRKSGSIRTPIIELDVQRAILITSYPEVLSTDEFRGVERVHYYPSTFSSQNLVAIIYQTDKQREMLVIENTPRLARLLPKYCVSAVNVQYK